MDVSVELGAGITIPLYVFAAHAYLGVNVSIPGRQLTPYFAYQHHWGSSSSIESGAPVDAPFRQRMIFIGLECAGEWSRTTTVELFSGASEDYDRGEGAKITTWGFNYLVRY